MTLNLLNEKLISVTSLPDCSKKNNFSVGQPARNNNKYRNINKSNSYQIKEKKKRNNPNDECSENDNFIKYGTEVDSLSAAFASFRPP
jgi:hypothetical protein